VRAGSAGRVAGDGRPSLESGGSLACDAVSLVCGEVGRGCPSTQSLQPTPDGAVSSLRRHAASRRRGVADAPRPG